MKKAGNEATETYIRRISSTVCGKHGNGDFKNRKGGRGGGMVDSILDKYLKEKNSCHKAGVLYDKKPKECRQLQWRYQTKKNACDSYQKNMDSNACNHAIMVKDTCETYAGCRNQALAAYNSFARKAKIEQTDRRAEWRGLKRMECLITAFGNPKKSPKVTNAEITACKKATHDTRYFILKFPPLAKLIPCTTPTLYPASGAYKRREFQPLPALAKGMESAQCAGVGVVSTTPRKGSPKGTKCVRLALQGDYSAGALLKCTNGLTVYRSTQKNSCPLGTKIFSPATRNDWKTFIASAGPLRHPHWIIDVTRPQNGCGGCTGHPMNSGNNQQKTWRTSDGSPWWLRSSRYGEPNGDYHANCFLDLWQKPRNENSVTFNDGSCSYRSRSYYCQPEALSLKPKAGSPRSCQCSKVDLARPYSAGFLVQCNNCITVYRSTQKNSCPNGMKIFSPATRGDWKAFLASARPLRAPHWIIDVTRPQNGCGGCTRHAMNGKNAHQKTWRTSDGSPWWLRSSRYGEPNGDYHANCFLDLWHTPRNENSVTFNDGSCHYRSRSYYCQPKRGSKHYGDRRPRVKRVAPPKAIEKMTRRGGAANSYTAWANVCASKGAHLCEWKDYCPNGRGKNPKLGRERGDLWAPIGDSDNDWVQLADSRVCKKHSDHWGKPGWGKRNNPYGRVAYCCNGQQAVECSKLSTLAQNNFNNRGDVSLNVGSTYTYKSSCGYTMKLSGWTHTRRYAKGFLRNRGGSGKAVVEGLKAGHRYNFKIYQYASHYAGSNAYLVNGVNMGRTRSGRSDAATATGTAVADGAGKVTFTFVRQTHHVHLSGIAIAEAGR